MKYDFSWEFHMGVWLNHSKIVKPQGEKMKTGAVIISGIYSQKNNVT